MRLSNLVCAALAAWFLVVLSLGRELFIPAFALSLAALWALFDRSSGRPWSRYPVATVFYGFLALYLSTCRYRPADDLPSLLVPWALLRHGTLALDAFVPAWLSGQNRWYAVEAGGHTLSFYPPWTGFFSLPFFVWPWACGAPLTVGLLRWVSKISAAVVTAGSVALFFAAARQRSSKSWAAQLAILYGAGSWAFSVSSQALWQHGPSQLAAALGLWGLSSAGALAEFSAGLGLAGAAAIRPDSVFFLAAGFLYVALFDRRRIRRFAIGAAVPIATTVAYWLYYTHALRPPELNFQAGLFVGFQPDAFLALLLSPTRGLIPFFPAALFAVWAVFARREDRLMQLLLLACAGQWFFFSCYAGWVGGNTFGSRYFAVAALVLAWLCSGVEPRVRKSAAWTRAWIGCLCLCVLIHAIGAFGPWPGPAGVEEQKRTAWQWTLYPLIYTPAKLANLTN